MADANKVTVEGNLTRDAVLIEKEGRVTVSLLRIACNRRRTRFFNVKVYGSRAAEVAAFVKGQKVLVNEGYLDSYTKGEGDGRHDVVSIVAGDGPDGITLVQKAGDQSEASTVSGDEPAPAAKASSKPSAGKSTKSSTKGKSTKGKSTKSKARS
jgi:single-stranded DNA-binding protein